MADNIELSYPQMTRQREENIQSQQVANAEDVNVELDHIVETYNRLIMLLTGEWGDGTGKIYEMVDNAIAVANEAKAIADNCVKKSGDTLTGLLSCAVVPNSDYNLVNKKYVDDKIITELADPLGRIESLENFRDNLKAEQVKLENTNFSAKNLHDGMTELFISVSSGKATVAAAITGKGIETAADASFKTMADNINAILTFNEGTASGTATSADILSGKTAYARGQLIIGSLNLNGLYDTSDSTATPYDIAIGKVAYGNNGRIVGALNISDDGNINYDTAGVKKIYGYTNTKLLATTAFNPTNFRKLAIGVNKNTGDQLFSIRCTTGAFTNSQITFKTHLISRRKDGSFIYANEKEMTLDLTEMELASGNWYVVAMQVSDCSNLSEVYLHMFLSKPSSSSSYDQAIVVCKLKRTYEENLEDSTRMYHWEIDKEGGFWFVKGSAISSLKNAGSGDVSRINISSIGDKNGKYGIVFLESGSGGIGICSYTLLTGTNIIQVLTNKTIRFTSSFSWGICTSYLGYNDRFLCIVASKYSSYIIWLSKSFTVGTYKADYFLTPDGNKLVADDGYVYDFRGQIEAAGMDGVPEINKENYTKIGRLPVGMTRGIVSPSSNMIISYYGTRSQENDAGVRKYSYNVINEENGEFILGDEVPFGTDLNIVGDNQPRYDYVSNDGSIYTNVYINNSGKEITIAFLRDYSEVIALEYEGDYYYKGTYTGDLTPGGES